MKGYSTLDIESERAEKSLTPGGDRKASVARVVVLLLAVVAVIGFAVAGRSRQFDADALVETHSQLEVEKSGSQVRQDAGSWKLILRQTVGTNNPAWFTPAMQAAGVLNAADPANPNFMDVANLGPYAVGGVFTFKMVWPGHAAQEWKQSSNPWTTTSATGYVGVTVPFTTYWHGLAKSNYAVFDGEPSSGNWWYAVGSFQGYGSGIPGPYPHTVNSVELFVWDVTPVSPPQGLTFSPAQATVLSPVATVDGGRFVSSFANVKKAIETYGCDSLNVYFWAVHHWSYSSAGSCAVTSTDIIINAPGSPSGTWRGAWALNFKIMADNSVTQCTYKGQHATGCHLHGHGSGWFEIVFSVKQQGWYKQARPVSPQVNTQYHNLIVHQAGECPHFEITDSTGCVHKFESSSCWVSNTDWVSIIGVNSQKSVVVELGVSTSASEMHLYNCHILNVGGTATAVSLNANFPASFGIGAACSVAAIKILV